MDVARGPRGGKDAPRLLEVVDGACSGATAAAVAADSSSNSSSRGTSGVLPPEAQALFAGGPSREESLAAAAARSWKGYLYGQLANVAKAAVWWSSFGVLSVSLLGSPYSVGILRGAFNCALVLLSPVASAAAERVSMRSLLLATTAARWLVWSVVMPLAWLVVSVHLERPDLFRWLALLLVFFDGVQVAFANVVDVDCGGVDALAAQLGVSVWPGLRERFNRLHHITFDLSFIGFTPPVSLLLLYCLPLLPLPLFIEGLLGPLEERRRLFWLFLGEGFVFGLLSCLSLFFYCGIALPRRSGSDDRAQREGQEETAAAAAAAASRDAREVTAWQGDSLCSEDSLTDFSGDSEPLSLLKETALRLHDVREGLFLVLRQKALAWRVLFLAFETALEDSMVSVVLPLLSLYSPSLFGSPSDVLAANMWNTCLISVGKAGGCLGGAIMSRFWDFPVSPTRRSAYRGLFRCAFASAAALMLLPAALMLREWGGAPRAPCVALVFLSSFLFFAFSSAPKMGFASLLQGLVSSQQVACRVFGFVGAFVSVTDAIIILLVNVLFAFLLPKGPLVAVAAVCLLFVTHGLLEALLGPVLVLEREEGEPRRLQGQEHTNNNPTTHGQEQKLAAVRTSQQLEGLLQRDSSQPSTACTRN